MTGSRYRRKKGTPPGQSTPIDLPEGGDVVLLLVAAAAVDDELLQGCPAAVLQQQPASHSGNELQQSLELKLESWSQLGELLSWFVKTVLPADAAAQLKFAASLPKEARADVHMCVSKKHGKVCQSVSDGFGEQRHVAVVAKGAASTQRLSSEHHDHALALWHLYKQQLKQHNKQLQQQQAQAHSAEEQAAADLTSGLHALQLNAAAVAVAAAEAAAAAAAAETAAPKRRQYSRDEVAQMMAQGQLTDELAALWASPAGEAQRQCRLLCLAASAGDSQHAQEFVNAHPSLVPSSVMDLSSGGQLPLHLAAAAGSVEVLQLLLAAGADVEAKIGTGETALQVAQRCEQCDCEALLLQAGAKNTQPDSWRGFADGEL